MPETKTLMETKLSIPFFLPQLLDLKFKLRLETFYETHSIKIWFVEIEFRFFQPLHYHSLPLLISFTPFHSLPISHILIPSFSYSAFLSYSFFPSIFLFLCLSFFLSASFSTFHPLSIWHPHSQHQSHKEVQRCDRFKKYSPFQKNSEHKAEIFPTKSYQWLTRPLIVDWNEISFDNWGSSFNLIKVRGQMFSLPRVTGFYNRAPSIVNQM